MLCVVWRRCVIAHVVLQEKVQSVCGSTDYQQKMKENEEEIASLEE